jgi:hypothetical protein
MKKALYIIVSLLAFVFYQCRDHVIYPDKFGLKIESIDQFEDTVLIKSKLMLQSSGISEYGYCWIKSPEIPTLSNSSFTCNGPLIESVSFKEKIKLEKGNYNIRAYIIYDKLIEYSDSRSVTLQD